MNKGIAFHSTLGWCISGVSSIVIVFLCAANMVLAQDIDSLRNGIVKLVATVDGKQKTGTGFIVQHGAESTLIVTAAHVVEGDKFPRAEFYGRRNDPIEAEVLRIEGHDERRGIAMLKARNASQIPHNVVALPITILAGVQDGEDLVTIGFPSGGGSWDVLKITITSRDGRDLLLSGGLEEGNSGGPILKQGKVIGLVTSTDKRGQAIPAEIVTMTLQGWGIAIAAGQDNNTLSATTTKSITDSRLPFEPEMVHIPSGAFLMGSPATESAQRNNESPQHQVTIAPFAISRTETTVEQFRQFVQDKEYHLGKEYRTNAEQDDIGCTVMNVKTKKAEQLPQHNWKNPGFDQSNDHPVVCVTWNDAQAYVAWLSHRTSLKYRLPTEAEWEYAARAGTTTARFYPDDNQCKYANALGQEGKFIADPSWILANCSDGYVYTAPVARFGHNPFGLFDMLGNVAEWTQDCWHANYTNAPTNGSAWLEVNSGNCNSRMVRSGSWISDPRAVRSADRHGFDSAAFNIGFRVVRTL